MARRECERSRIAAAIFVLLASLLLPVSAEAQQAGRDLHVEQSTTWYAGHGAATVLLGLSSFVLEDVYPKQPHWRRAPAFERGAENHHNEATARASDGTLLTSVVLSPVAFAGEGAIFWGNASLIYAETLSATATTTGIVKIAVGRLRPQGHRPGRAVEPDDYRSFFSGHASMAFTGAMSGGYLLSSGNTVDGFKAALWGGTLSLAAFTAHARVRAGRHYPTDVMMGALVGAGVGVLVPYLHNVRVEPSVAEWVAMGGGLALGVGAAAFLPSKESARTLAFLERWQPAVVPVDGGALVSVRGKLW